MDIIWSAYAIFHSVVMVFYYFGGKEKLKYESDDGWKSLCININDEFVSFIPFCHKIQLNLKTLVYSYHIL